MAALVRVRDRNHCQFAKIYPLICKECKSKGLEVHHIVARNGTNNTVNNLILLCPAHHDLLHGIENGECSRIQVIMADYGITQRELAAALCVTQPAISQILRNNNCSVARAKTLKKYINEKTGKKYIIEDLFEKVRPKPK